MGGAGLPVLPVGHLRVYFAVGGLAALRKITRLMRGCHSARTCRAALVGSFDWNGLDQTTSCCLPLAR